MTDIVSRRTIRQAGRVIGPVLEMTAFPYVMLASTIGLIAGWQLGFVNQQEFLSGQMAGLAGASMMATAILMGRELRVLPS